MEHGLSKKERISSLKAIEHLIARGHYVGSGPLRCCWVIRDTGVAEAIETAEKAGAAGVAGLAGKAGVAEAAEKAGAAEVAEELGTAGATDAVGKDGELGTAGAAEKAGAEETVGKSLTDKVIVKQGTPVHLNRIVVSVPKKMFRRAVKRNLLKRRIREAYRLQKQLLTGNGVDLMFVYKSKDIAPYSQISDCVAAILKQISSKLHKNEQI